MKKIFYLISLLILSTSLKPINLEVYICVSKGAKKYHLVKDCNGLSNCKHEIKKVTKKDAESKGLTLCGWED